MKIENGHLKIDIHNDLLTAPSQEQRDEIAKWAAFQECVVDAAVNTLVTGSQDGEGDWWVGGLAQRMRERLLPLMDKATAGLVSDLMRERDQAVAEHKRMDAWAWSLWHEARKCQHQSRHEYDNQAAPYVYVPPIDPEKAMAEARRRFEERSAAPSEARPS